jgi:GDP-L-fucose synthase
MKRVLITGSSGLVGTYLIEKFKKENFDVVGVDIRPPVDRTIKYELLDLTINDNVKKVINKYKPDLVVNSFGIKGSPIRAKTKPVDFLYPSFKINTDIIHNCAMNNIWLIFMSSVGVYSPSEKFTEDDVWKTLPSENDWYPSWSKRMGELLLKSYEIQYGYKKWSVVRPANIYGEYDDFSGNGTVISSTVKKIFESNGTIECWGDGTPVRDFVYGKDVANAIFKLYQNNVNDIVNFGSGEEITIKSMVDSLIKISGKDIVVFWDNTKPNGDMRRQMDTERQKKYDILPDTSFYDGLKNTYEYYVNHLNL